MGKKTGKRYSEEQIIHIPNRAFECLSRDPADWHPYNPNAERDARIEAEGLYSGPIQQFIRLDEDEDEPRVEPVPPDFDL